MLEAVERELCLLEAMRSVLLCKLEASEGALYLLDVPEVIRCVLLCMLEVLKSRLCLLDVLEVIRRVFCMLGAVEGELGLLKVLEVMPCVPLCTLYAVEVGSVCWSLVMRRVQLCMLRVSSVW